MLSFEAQAKRPHEAPVSHAASPLAMLVMDQIDCGLIVCDAHGHMLQANRAAQRELEGGHILKLMEGVVRCRGESSDELHAAIDAAARRGLRRLVCPREADTPMIVVTPLAPDAADRRPLALVMLGRRTLCTPLGLELLAMQHRLTLAEQRVLRALVGGASVRDIALEHCVAVSTIRTQLQSMREKVGVSNIDKLLLTAARVPPVPSCH